MYEQLYSQITDALVEDGYIVIQNALDEKLADILISFVKNMEGFTEAGISSTSELHIDKKRRRDKTLWLDEDNGVQTQFLEFSTGLKNYLNRSLYLGLREYEAHFALYESGDFYEKHLDAFKNSKNRVVTTVYYLNENWDKKSGGELIIYDENDKKIAEVLPEKNTLVVFMSEKFPHEVLEANMKRYSIAGWFRVD